MSAEIYFQTMETIAQTLPDVPDETLPSQMQTFQMFMGLCGEPYRDRAAALLSSAAGRSSGEQRKNLLANAAKLLASGWPIEQTPEIPRATEAGPRLLHLTPWDMFPGLAVRIGTTFTARGDTFSEGEILHFRRLDFLPYHEGYTFNFEEKNIYLCGLQPADAPALENCGNQYFEPYPSLRCLKSCLNLVQSQWRGADRSRIEGGRSIEEEIGRCARWLAAPEGPAPLCTTGQTAMEQFHDAEGNDEGLGFRLAFLFVGVTLLA